MRPLAATLLADGSSDAVLVPLLKWLLRQEGLHTDGFVLADLRPFRRPALTLSERVRLAVQHYPCQLLFVHRDAEREDWARRRAEVQDALCDLDVRNVAVIPVRMTEAWFLFSESAIRRVSGNPRGTAVLTLPPTERLEDIVDPKGVLLQALRLASGLKGRRLDQFRAREKVQQLPLEIESYAPLRVVPAFHELEREVRDFASAWRASIPPA